MTPISLAYQNTLAGVHAADPEEAAANKVALDRVTAHLANLQQGDTPGAFRAPGAFGAAGAFGGAFGGAAGGALGGLTVGNLLTAQHNAALEHNAADKTRIEANNSIGQENGRLQKAADDALKEYQTTAANEASGSMLHPEDAVVAKYAPRPGLTKDEFDAWQNTPIGRTDMALFMKSLRRSALSTTHFFNLGDSAPSSINALDPSHFRFDAQGNFTGLDNDANDNAYPVSKILGRNKFNAQMISAFGPQYLKWLHDEAVARRGTQNTSG
ncbi:MAG: hypothetical protein KGJ32_06550 [Xanthomonadaceae bacterium]|nr:hypothetical protein [Xanthomonadaceae bacterium]